MLQVLKYLFPSPLCLLIHWMVLSWVANINFIPIFFFFCCFFICNVLREYHLCKCIKLPFSKTTWMHHKFKAHLSTKHHLSRYTNLKGRLCRGCDFSLFFVVFISFYLFFLHKQTVKKIVSISTSSFIVIVWFQDNNFVKSGTTRKSKTFFKGGGGCGWLVNNLNFLYELELKK